MAMFERSADAVSALAAAWRTFYQRRGFPLLNNQGEPVRDPFRRGMGNAIQWYDHLRHRHEAVVEEAIDECLKLVQDAFDAPVPTAGISGEDALAGSHESWQRAGVLDGPYGGPAGGLLGASSDGQCEGSIGGHRGDPHRSQCGGPLEGPLRESRASELGSHRNSARIPSQDRRQHSPSSAITMESNDAKGAIQVEDDSTSKSVPLVVGQCDRVLQKRCPACSGGSRFGRTFKIDGGDVHVAMAATFSQRHNVSAGDNPWHHDPKYFISKEQVDA
ncbi:hypothetical protein OH77DRAFT_1279159 [Trametes cingulata]|nr:hypothetical protein OH77DRAFT_1279159 [Trametes cingulata]